MMGDGHLNKCKSCTKKDTRRHYAETVEERKIYELERNKDPKRKENQRKYARKMVKENHGKYKARYKVLNAIRDGKIKRLPCVKCGEAKSQAHHVDYRKMFEIVWLCFPCHRTEHKEHGK